MLPGETGARGSAAQAKPVHKRPEGDGSGNYGGATGARGQSEAEKQQDGTGGGGLQAQETPEAERGSRAEASQWFPLCCEGTRWGQVATSRICGGGKTLGLIART